MTEIKGWYLLMHGHEFELGKSLTGVAIKNRWPGVSQFNLVGLIC